VGLKHGDIKAQGLFAVIKENLRTNKITSVSFAEEWAAAGFKDTELGV
jgi:hypothetical protein